MSIQRPWLVVALFGAVCFVGVFALIHGWIQPLFSIIENGSGHSAESTTTSSSFRRSIFFNDNDGNTLRLPKHPLSQLPSEKLEQDELRLLTDDQDDANRTVVDEQQSSRRLPYYVRQPYRPQSQRPCNVFSPYRTGPWYNNRNRNSYRNSNWVDQHFGYGNGRIFGYRPNPCCNNCCNCCNKGDSSSDDKNPTDAETPSVAPSRSDGPSFLLPTSPTDDTPQPTPQPVPTTPTVDSTPQPTAQPVPTVPTVDSTPQPTAQPVVPTAPTVDSTSQPTTAQPVLPTTPTVDTSQPTTAQPTTTTSASTPTSSTTAPTIPTAPMISTATPTAASSTLEPTDQFNIELMNMGSETTYDAVLQAAANRWERVIVGDLTDVPENPDEQDLFNGAFPGAAAVNQAVDDILIGYDFTGIDGPNKVLGQATPTRIAARASTPGNKALPYASVITFDTEDFQNKDINNPADFNTLVTIAVHEMGHALGIGALWSQVCGTGCPGNTNYGCPAAQDKFDDIFPGETLKMNLDETSDGSQVCGHWDATQYSQESWQDIMAPGLLPSKQSLLTIISAGAMEDLGYTVNYNAADSIPAMSTAFFVPDTNSTAEEEEPMDETMSIIAPPASQNSNADQSSSSSPPPPPSSSSEWPKWQTPVLVTSGLAMVGAAALALYFQAPLLALMQGGSSGAAAGAGAAAKGAYLAGSAVEV
ncbi:hypothetical protein ACA910_009642 [Epithemia clementina (nom. ined.)]